MFKFIENWLIKKYLEVAQPFYPKASMPKSREEYEQMEAGSQALAVYTHVRDQIGVLCPSYIWMVQQQMAAGVRPRVSVRDWNLLDKAAKEGNKRIFKLRRAFYQDYGPRCTFDFMQEYRVANCGEASNCALEFLYAKGIEKPKAFCCGFLEDDKIWHQKHEFVMYTLKGTPTLSCEEKVCDLTNPNLRILDLWSGQCGQAMDVINHWANMFVIKYGANERYTRMPSGLDFVLQEHMSTSNKNIYVVGSTCEQIQNGVRETVVSLSPKPACYREINKQESNPSKPMQGSLILRRPVCLKRVRAPWEGYVGRGAREV